MATSVLLVDDHAVFRKGLRLLLEEEEDLRVVGEAGAGREAITRVRELSPDIVIMDISMPNLNGIEAARKILAAAPQTRIVALSIHAGKRFVADMLQAGAAGYLLKENAPEELVDGIRSVMRGEVCLSGSIAGVVVSEYRKAVEGTREPLDHDDLSVRDREVVRLLVEGNTAEQIAGVLNVSPRTVASQQRSIMETLGVTHVEELAAFAGTQGAGKEMDRVRAGEAGMESLLRTKLHRPAVTPDLVVRSQLIDQLERHRTLPLTLVSASAGFGKSTLASSWMESTSRPGAWLSLDEEDNDLRLFLSYFIAAVQTCFPDVGGNMAALLSAPDLPPVSVLARELLNEIEEADEPFILVLDDYHHIKETAVHDLLSELLRRPPRGFHLVLLTRRDPPLPIGVLRARGEMHEIGSAQLRFSIEETASFLKNALSRQVEKATATTLDEKFEGWPAGLRLLLHSLKGPEDLDRILGALQGDFGYIMEYLVSEVLFRQPPAVVGCLLKTSILDRFCAPLCDAVYRSGGERGEERLTGIDFMEKLRKTNLFVIPLDTRNRWYRYHHLFGELLRRHLKQRSSPEEITTIHSRASAWFFGQGLVEEAIDHALAAGDVTGATQMIETSRHVLLDRDQWYVFERWLAKFPETVVQQRPALLLARVWVHYHHFDIPAIPSILDLIEPLLVDPFQERTERAEIDFFHGYLSYFENDGSRSLEHLRRALDQVPDSCEELRGQIEILYGLAMQMQGRKDEAVHRLNGILYPGPFPESVKTTRLLVTLAYIHLISTDLDKSLAANQQLYEFSTTRGYAYAEAWSVYLQGLTHYYANRLDEAVDCFHRAVRQQYVLHTRAVIDALSGLAFCYQALRQPEKAVETTQQLMEYVSSLDDPSHAAIARSCEAHVSVLQGKPKPAGRWFDDASSAENMVWWIEIPAVTHCRLLLADGSDESTGMAAGKLHELLALNRKNHNTLHRIEILSLLAVVCSKQGGMQEAVQFLGEAVALAEQGSVIRPFLEAGPPMAGLLTRLKKERKAEGFVDRILSALEEQEHGAKQDRFEAQTSGSPEARPQPLVEPLSRRELEILNLLAKGLFNREIAEKLFISTETVKTHLRSIYQKLGVSKRREAVNQAAALGILPGT